MKNPNHARVLMYTIILCGLLVAGISALVQGIEPLKPMFYLGAGLAFGGIALGVLKVRCPHCGHGLPLRGGSLSFCPHCA